MPRSEPDALLLLAGKPKPGEEENDMESMDPMEQKRDAVARMFKAAGVRLSGSKLDAAAEAFADAYDACMAAHESEEAEPYSEEGDDEGG